MPRRETLTVSASLCRHLTTGRTPTLTRVDETEALLGEAQGDAVSGGGGGGFDDVPFKAAGGDLETGGEEHSVVPLVLWDGTTRGLPKG